MLVGWPQFEQQERIALFGFDIGILIVVLGFPVLVAYPFWRLLRRAGYKPAWSLLTLVPFLGMFAAIGILCTLAFGQWPAVVGPAEETSWSIFSRTAWIKISPEEAAKNRYYGIDGWLVALFGLLAAGIGSSLVSLLSATGQEVSRMSYGISSQGALSVSLLGLGWTVSLLILISLKQRAIVPKLVIASSWLYVGAFVMILNIFEDPLVTASAAETFGSAGAMNSIVVGTGLVSASLTTWCWLKSKRVNVTYTCRVPSA